MLGAFSRHHPLRRLAPIEEASLPWPSFFALGTTFAFYVAHLEKACLLPRLDNRWGDTAVMSTNHGLAKAGDRSLFLGPATGALAQIAGTRGRRDQLTLVAVVSWTFPFRVFRECLPLTTQRAGEDLRPEERVDRNAAIGLVGGKLILKLNRRRHMAAGPIIPRVRMCDSFS